MPAAHSQLMIKNEQTQGVTASPWAAQSVGRAGYTWSRRPQPNPLSAPPLSPVGCLVTGYKSATLAFKL